MLICNGLGRYCAAVYFDSLGELVRRWRAKNGLNQRDAARRMGVARRTLAGVEGGGNFSVDTVEAIGRALSLNSLHDLARALDEVRGVARPPEGPPLVLPATRSSELPPEAQRAAFEATANRMRDRDLSRVAEQLATAAAELARLAREGDG